MCPLPPHIPYHTTMPSAMCPYYIAMCPLLPHIPSHTTMCPIPYCYVSHTTTCPIPYHHVSHTIPPCVPYTAVCPIPPCVHVSLYVCSVLLFDKGKVLKLCDFGTAKKLEHTLTNAVGTIRYMAPEVIRGQCIMCLTRGASPWWQNKNIPIPFCISAPPPYPLLHLTLLIL